MRNSHKLVWKIFVMLILASMLIFTVLPLGSLLQAATLPYDLSVNSQGISFSQNSFYAGDTVRVYGTVENQGSQDITGFVQFFKGSSAIGQPIAISAKAAGQPEEVWVDWVADVGTYNLQFRVLDTDPNDQNLSNNVTVSTTFTVTDRPLPPPPPPATTTGTSTGTGTGGTSTGTGGGTSSGTGTGTGTGAGSGTGSGSSTTGGSTGTSGGSTGSASTGTSSTTGGGSGGFGSASGRVEGASVFRPAPTHNVVVHGDPTGFEDPGAALPVLAQEIDPNAPTGGNNTPADLASGGPNSASVTASVPLTAYNQPHKPWFSLDFLKNIDPYILLLAGSLLAVALLLLIAILFWKKAKKSKETDEKKDMASRTADDEINSFLSSDEQPKQ